MLSRTADNLYWLSRYVERAEYLARILDATQRLSTLPLAYVGTSNEWESEGADRTTMDLPGAQAELIERVTAVNPPRPSW